MSKYIAIIRPNGVVTLVRNKNMFTSEDPLTEHEIIINELYNQLNNISQSQTVELERNNYHINLHSDHPMYWICTKCNAIIDDKGSHCDVCDSKIIWK